MVQRLVRQLGWSVLLATLLLSGCSSLQQPTPTTFHGAPQVPANDSLIGTPAEVLLASADKAMANGNTQAAGRYLERAIALAPGSSWLYRQMSKVRLQEGNARVAEGFVRHALRNAPSDAGYRAGLYRLLATCLVQQGEAAKADAALVKARELGQ